jgi:class 3 adenylate cyclase
MVYVVFLTTALFPTFFFIAAQLTTPGGAARFLNGPIAYVNLFLVVVVGFVFDARLTLLVSLEAGVGYFVSFLVARDGLAAFRVVEPSLAHEIVSWQDHLVKSVMIVVTGVAMAGLALVVRRLIRRVVAEERQRAAVDRVLGEYVSEEVKERLLQDPSAQRGERKEVVVLFSDLRGFTTMSETVPPEQMVERLNAYFDAMVEAVAASGGVVDKFIGDAVMAVFGGVLPLPDPCAASVAAAREMRRRLAALNAAWQRAGLAPLDNGIGLHVGEVVMGSIGSRRRKNFTVIGDVVNTAARVEGLTRELPEPVLLTEAVWRRLPDELRGACVGRGLRKVKGRKAEVEVYGLPD